MSFTARYTHACQYLTVPAARNSTSAMSPVPARHKISIRILAFFMGYETTSGVVRSDKDAMMINMMERCIRS
ncbi:hypothetical protein Apmu_0118_08 [Acidiphilium multivorum AIU301]|nr:hypothetical protein Apmu_0118_08 [Acidiphilium multivorum AIU301]